MDDDEDYDKEIKEFGIDSRIWRLIIIEFACNGGKMNVKKFLKKKLKNNLYLSI